MIEPEAISNRDSPEHLIRVQLIIGMMAVPLLIVNALLNAIYTSRAPFGDSLTIIVLVSYFAGITGSVFSVVGVIAIIKRNGSMLAWIFVAVFCISQVWRYAFSFVIFPTIMHIPDIDSISVISTISSVYGYSILLVSLYGWSSIQSTVKYRPLYYTYLILYTFGGMAASLVAGILFGFGPHSVRTFEKAFALRAPGLVTHVLTVSVLLLFFISQLYDSRTEQQYGSTTTELDNW